MHRVNLWASLWQNTRPDASQSNTPMWQCFAVIVPDVFCDLLKAEAVNTAWLRTIGAALIGTNVVNGINHWQFLWQW